MERELEQEFVGMFVQKYYRERIIYELANKKKRHNAIQKLPTMIDEKYIVLDATKMSPEAVIDYLKGKTDTEEECYIIADCSDDDGKKKILREAIEEYFYFGGITVLICKNSFAFIKDELCVGSCWKCILHHPNENALTGKTP